MTPTQAQLLQALEVVEAACERDRALDEWIGCTSIPDRRALYDRFCDAGLRERDLTDAYRARWSR